METKICTRCNLPKDKAEFVWGQCRKCRSLREKEYRRDRISPKMRKRLLARRKAYRKVYRESILEDARNWRLANKQKAFDAYGGRVCVWCGDDDFNVLVIDHVNNDGSKQRKKVFGIQSARGGGSMYLWLRKNNYPKGYQVLCASCNHGKELNGGVLPPNRKDLYRKSREPIEIHTFLLAEYARKKPSRKD